MILEMIIKCEKIQQISYLTIYKNIFVTSIIDMKEMIPSHLHRISLLTSQSDDRSHQFLSFVRKCI